MAASMMLLLGSCSTTDSQDAADNRNDGTGKPGKVSFTLGGAIGDKQTRAGEDGTELQTTDEKKVSTLLAVVFRDVSHDITTGTNDAEDDGDTYFQTCKIVGADNMGIEDPDRDTELQADKEYTITIDAPGYYHICFVANPSQSLEGRINGMQKGKTTVADFKAFVEDQAPETKPMLMNSEKFYGVVYDENMETIDLGKVILKRAMARIDIVNLANGITIKDAVFKNRAVKTRLITDNADESIWQANLGDQTFSGINLEGKYDGTAEYKEQIYTYEMFGADAGVPTMDLTYTYNEKTYTHTVEFKKNDGTPINLDRNHLYRIKVINENSSLRITITVADWNEGEEFIVKNEEVNDGFDIYKNVELGDIMLSDGTIVSHNAELTEEQKAQAIGIVATLYSKGAKLKDGVRKALADKGVKHPHGLVLALKNIGSYAWATANVDEGYGIDTYKGQYENGLDGYEITQSLNNANHPAFKAAVDYEQTVPTTGLKSTGWYLPSIGEAMDILDVTGIGQEGSVYGRYKQWEGLTGRIYNHNAMNSINRYLDILGDKADKYGVGYYNVTTSEINNESVAVYIFSAWGNTYTGLDQVDKTRPVNVRSVLAF